MADPWPFVGRAAEFDAVRSALLAPAGRGVLVAGAVGVGKTRLATRVADDLDSRGHAVVRAKATQAAARIPYGALAHLLPDGPGGPAVELPRGRHGGLPVLAVDDAHSLDPASTKLVNDLLSGDRARLLATVRTGAEEPAQLAALCRRGAVRRVELGPLSPAETADLLERALGGQVEETSARRLWRITGGNPLFLRELVLAGVLSRAAEAPGVWRSPPGPAVTERTPRLRELLEARIGDLDPQEREVLEFLAFGEPLGEGMLRELTAGPAVDRVLRRHLVTATDDGGRRELRLAHPLYGEVVRAGTGTYRTMTRLRTLAEATEATGLRRREDVLQVAAWRLDSHSPADPELLLRAGRYAWSALDLELAARLGRAALRTGGGGAAAIMLATVLHFADRDDEADAVLRLAAGEPASDRERAQHATTRALVLGWGLARDSAADQVLATAAAAVRDPAWRRHVLAVTAWIDLFAGRVADARAALRRAREPAAAAPADAPPAIAAETAAAEALVAAYGGRPLHALAAADRALRQENLWRDEVPVVRAALAHARTAAHLFAGNLPAALDCTGQGLGLVREFGEWPRVAASFSGWRAQVYRLRGDLHAALRWAREGAAKLGGRSAMFAGLCFGELAAAAAQLGQLAVADQALARAGELSQAAWRGVEFSMRLATPWVMAARGQPAEAARTALATAAEARQAGLTGYEILALHDALRLAASTSTPAATSLSAQVAARLSELATPPAREPADPPDDREPDPGGQPPDGGGPDPGGLVRAFARHAVAVARRDAAGLDAASREFEGLDMILHAAEAAAQAMTVHLAAGRHRAAAAADGRARLLTGRCPGARTPPLAPLASPLLTPRQRQIALLAIQGLTNREIAARLAISVRTVGNHLVTIYERLGVTNRAALAAAIDTPTLRRY